MDLTIYNIFVILVLFIIVAYVYNNYKEKHDFIECERNKLIKQYNYYKYISIDLLHANMIYNIINTLDSKKNLKEKIQFLKNL